MLPGIDGFELCRTIRRSSDVPIVMVTARADTVDVVVGLESGADDYVRKPFGLEEFLLRVSAVLRRSGGRDTSVVLSCGDVTLDLGAAKATHGDAEINLSPTEFRLLHKLMSNPGQVLSKSHLLETVWGIDYDSTTTVVETFVSYLRRKLNRPGHEHIVTVRGFGIKFDALS